MTINYVKFESIKYSDSVLTLLIYTFYDASAADNFLKTNDKRRNCSKRAISPFATMFSTFSHRISIQL